MPSRIPSHIHTDALHTLTRAQARFSTSSGSKPTETIGYSKKVGRESLLLPQVEYLGIQETSAREILPLFHLNFIYVPFTLKETPRISPSHTKRWGATRHLFLTFLHYTLPHLSHQTFCTNLLSVLSYSSFFF